MPADVAYVAVTALVEAKLSATVIVTVPSASPTVASRTANVGAAGFASAPFTRCAPNGSGSSCPYTASRALRAETIDTPTPSVTASAARPTSMPSLSASAAATV